VSDTGTIALGGFSFSNHGMRREGGGQRAKVGPEQLVLGEQLGRGASSRVRLGVRKSTGQLMAIKVISASIEQDKASRQMVLNEVRTACDASSEHIVTFFDAYVHEGSLHIVLEYMDAGPLDCLLRLFPAASAARSPVSGGIERGPLPEAVLAEVISQMLAGLTYLHTVRRCVHRDLKPANVLLSATGVVKLSDFGISKQLMPDSASSSISEQLAETYCGTTAYMSPERHRGEAYSYPSDVWSLGLIALEGISGFPYAGFQKQFDLVDAIVHGPPPVARASSFASPPFFDLIERALSKDPAARPSVTECAQFPLIVEQRAAQYDLGLFLRGVEELHSPGREERARRLWTVPAE